LISSALREQAAENPLIDYSRFREPKMSANNRLKQFLRDVGSFNHDLIADHSGMKAIGTL